MTSKNESGLRRSTRCHLLHERRARRSRTLPSR